MMKAIPFYIVAFNRIEGLEKALKFVGNSSIPLKAIVLDMGSSWEKFIQYRDSAGIEVIHFPYGVGPRDLWVTGELEKLGDGPFFLTDGDIDFSQSPNNTAEKMKQVSDCYPWFPKVGLALKLSDLPNDNEGARVLAWELDHWKVLFQNNIYLTGVDTTIAYYPRRERTFYYRPALRLAGEFTVRHYPWYERQDSLNEEAKFYQQIAMARISTLQAAQWPSKSYLRNHAVLVKLFSLLTFAFKVKFLGALTVKLFSYRGTIRSNLKP